LDVFHFDFIGLEEANELKISNGEINVSLVFLRNFYILYISIKLFFCINDKCYISTTLVELALEIIYRFLICRFDKREEAQEAIAQLHGTIPEGGSEPLSVKIAEEHGKQKAAYYAGWQAGYNQSRGK